MRLLLSCFPLPFLLVAAAPPASPADTAPAARRPLVAVIDSGIARTPELAPWLVAEYDTASYPPRPAFRPKHDHGTMVATILLREARSPVDIVSFRIDDPSDCPTHLLPPCQTSPGPVVAAIRKATGLGADVINLSLSLQNDPTIVEAIRDAAARNVRVVIAAGNEGLAHPGNLPMAKAGYPKAVLVGAVDSKGRPWRRTNRPDKAHSDYAYVWQRGVEVPTVTADGAPVLGTGTSFAAPIETARIIAWRNATRSAEPAVPLPGFVAADAEAVSTTETGAGARIGS